VVNGLDERAGALRNELHHDVRAHAVA
jgi:hypothetical protein